MYNVFLTTIKVLIAFSSICTASVFAQTHTKPDQDDIHYQSDDNVAGPAYAEFSVKVNDIVSPHDIISVFLLPFEVIEIDIVAAIKGSNYMMSSSSDVTKLSNGRWLYRAPNQPSLKSLTITSDISGQQVVLNVFTMVPAEVLDGDKIGKYKIGHYPEDKPDHYASYIEPRGFVKVTEDMADIRVSPHFKLGSFLSKQQSRFPKYLYIEERLLQKLELIQETLKTENIRADNIVVMSGYRTPYYNRLIGNVKYSRHVYGDAADIFIDNDGDYYMDDINNDSQINYDDAEHFASIVNQIDEVEYYQHFIGGLGIYGKRPHRGPFIHVDTRGIKARWYQP